MYQQESPVLGSSTEDYALTLTEDETHDLRDALSASISTIPRSESDAASRRARLPAWWSRLAKRVMTWKQAKAEALRLVEQAARSRTRSTSSSFAQNSDDGLELHANSHASAADIGLPAYPGATLYKDTDSDSAVDLGLNLGDFHFTLKAANYVSSDSPAGILAFYRKPLSRYGEVLECDNGKPVGSHTVTRNGLTCSDEHDGHTQTKVNANSSSDHELRAGTPHQYRVVGIDKSQPGIDSLWPRLC